MDCFNDPNWENVAVGLFLVVATIVSYVPQYVSIVRLKSSEGINDFMLGTSLLGVFLTVINSGILNWSSLTCCSGLTFGGCLQNNLPTEQLLTSMICVFILYLFFLAYFPVRATKLSSSEEQRAGHKRAWIFFVSVLVVSIFLAVLAASLYFMFHLKSSVLSTYADVLGMISVVCNVVQYLPQIYTTFRLQSPGSLSVLMLALQLPGALLVIYFQAVLNHAKLSTWVPYVFQAIQQAILIVLCVFFKLQQRQKRQRDIQHDSQVYNGKDIERHSLIENPDHSESPLPSPLLSPSRRSRHHLEKP